MTNRNIAIALMALALGSLPVRADLIEKKSLTLDGARKIAAAAEAAAKKRNVGVVIAVVDDGGHLLVLERLDNTQVASVDVGIGKARTAAIFRRPTKEFEDGIAKGRTASLVIPGATPLQGGIPIVLEGKVIGAIGVSGDTPAQDEDIAKAGAAAVATFTGKSTKTSTEPVTYFDSPRVAAAFAKGMPLLETPSYKIHASRRTEPGLAEVHADETDVVYVLEGTATLVTGGTVIEPKNISPEEIRGSGIRGGESRTLRKGDVVVIPQGTPHWFKQVDGPFLYFVVKPIAKTGGAQ
jgi:glc operon protein GlcG